MIKDLLKWVAPGAVTVFGGTAAALAMATPSMVVGIGDSGSRALEQAGFGWARIAVDARDIDLRGTAPSLVARDDALGLLATIPGIGTIRHDVLVAPEDRPYRLVVTVENGIVSLSGSVPNAETAGRVKALANVDATSFAIRSGQPDERLWQSGLEFILKQAELVEEGRFELSDLSIDASLRANSQRALGSLQMAFADLPEGIAAPRVSLQPQRIAPYVWMADFDGRRLEISGFVPEQGLVERFHRADVSGLPVATGLALASGAPDDFSARSQLLLEQLSRLESGQAVIVDGASRLTGIPPSLEVAQAVTETLSGSGSVVALQPPRVVDYWASVTRQSGGVLVFDGFAPDEAARSAFAAQPEADITYLKLGSGAPASYRAAMDFGLDLLSRMGEGRFALRGNVFSASGMAGSAQDYAALTDLLDNVPRGLVVGQLDIRAPRADRYEFAMRREVDGAVVFSGMLPDAALERELREAAASPTSGVVSFASGEPVNFATAARQGLDFLPWLAEGEVRFDGDRWIVAGSPASSLDKASIETEFAVRGLVRSGWQLNLDDVAIAEAPPADASSALPVQSREVEAATEAPAPEVDESQAEAAPSSIDACSARLAELTAHNAILFQSGAAIIAAGAAAELDAFAEALSRCPDAIVYVEGHTDSDGDDQKNLALSVARAEAVVNALIERSVAPERLYAIGFGESRPVADNASADGKRQNRRIVVSLEDPRR